MPTECRIYYMDFHKQWFQSANQLNIFAWCEINNVVVAGSKTVAQPQLAVKTGDTVADINTWIQAVLQAMTGDAPLAFDYPTAMFTVGWGTDIKPEFNLYKNRPFIALGYRDLYQFGNLNLPAYSQGTHPRIWYFRIEGTGTNDQMSLGSNAITNYYNNNANTLPVFKVIELNPQ